MKVLHNVEIAGICAAVPKFTSDVADESCLTSSEAIRFSRHTGISKRRLVSDGLFTSDLCTPAVRQLLAELNWSTDDVELLVVVTQTPDDSAPGVALKIHGELSLPTNCLAFDINLGCSAFPYGISIVGSLIESLKLDKAILVIGDISSRLCHRDDKSTRPLFGDAGSACAVTRVEGKKIYLDLNSDGAGYEAINVRGGGLSSTLPMLSSSDSKIIPHAVSPWHMKMDGSKVFGFAIEKAPESINRLRNVFVEKKLEAVFLHQANRLINETIASRLGLSETVEFPSSLKSFGNTSSVTIPVTFVSEYGGQRRSGWYIACGFGVGLSWGSILFELNEARICKMIEV